MIQLVLTESIENLLIIRVFDRNAHMEPLKNTSFIDLNTNFQLLVKRSPAREESLCTVVEMESSLYAATRTVNNGGHTYF